MTWAACCIAEGRSLGAGRVQPRRVKRLRTGCRRRGHPWPRHSVLLQDDIRLHSEALSCEGGATNDGGELKGTPFHGGRFHDEVAFSWGLVDIIAFALAACQGARLARMGHRARAQVDGWWMLGDPGALPAGPNTEEQAPLQATLG